MSANQFDNDSIIDFVNHTLNRFQVRWDLSDRYHMVLENPNLDVEKLKVYIEWATDPSVSLLTIEDVEKSINLILDADLDMEGFKENLNLFLSDLELENEGD